MGSEHQSVVLRLEPAAIHAVRAALDESLNELAAHLRRLRQAGYIDRPWLGDMVSEQVQTHYNRYVMEAPDGPYAAIIAYEAELDQIKRTLAQIEREYRRAEVENQTRVGRS